MGDADFDHDLKHPVRAFIALGANLGDRRATLNAALNMLDEHEHIRVVRISTLIETDPVGAAEQPTYLNGAAEIETTLTARETLSVLLDIERHHGRDRTKETRWGPRRLDLDLLLYGDQIIDEPGLTIPHPRLHERRFVLEPLVEIAPEIRHPQLNRTAAELFESLIRTSKSADEPNIPSEYDTDVPC